MHNICVSDRVMEGNVHARYCPANILDIPELEEEEIGYPDDFNGTVQGGRRAVGDIGLRNGDPDVMHNVLTRQEHWRALNDILEHARLNEAIMAHVSNM
mmetsp:Transcript_7523/g.14264  ORF Transcript_7523/g.14264 Transcript_7523/m.14264 type:complete len:99 (+) Transcript_7523:81-377(+)